MCAHVDIDFFKIIQELDDLNEELAGIERESATLM